VIYRVVTELPSSLGSSVPALATSSERLVTVLAARLGSYLFTDLASGLVISLVNEFASRLLSRLIEYFTVLQLPHNVLLFPSWWMYCHVHQHGGACREQSGQSRDSIF
jgi:hypothetical protein